MRRIFGKFSLAFGLLLLAAAAGLVLFNNRESAAAGESAVEAVQELTKMIPEEHISVAVSEPEQTPNPLVWWESIPEDKVPEMPTVSLNGLEYIGVLEVPSLELVLPIIASYKHEWLKTAPTRFSGSVYSDDLVLCAHNYDSQFGRLKTLQTGDLVIFTDAAGRSWEYEVCGQTILKPTDYKEMTQKGDWELSLYTCTKTGNMRETIRCKRV